MEYTVFTPTYNRAEKLKRVYKSLLNQTCKEFVWLIVDDGSKDNSAAIVNSFIKENIIKIEYYFKENGGKQSAFKLAIELTKTKYLIEIDSDDELTADAVEVFRNEWIRVCADGKESEIAEIAAPTQSVTSRILGNYLMPIDKSYIDSNWFEMVLEKGNNNEYVLCWNTSKLKECVQIPDKFWNSNNVNFLGECIFWARISRKYKNRYINKPLRIYYDDASDSLLRITDKTKGHYNNVVSNKYFLDENLDYFFTNPRYFISPIIKFIVSVKELKINNVKKEITTSRFRLFYTLFYPLGFMFWLYYKFVLKRFWF